MDIKIKKRKKEGWVYFTNCPACNTEITGISEKHTESNLHSHLRIHTGSKK